MHMLLLCRDLMAMSSITSAVKQAGGTVRVVNAMPELAAAAEGATLIVLDLSAAASEAAFADSLKAARQAAPQARVVAFGPHVQQDLLERAQAAGCDTVLTRGQFMSQLAQLAGPKGND